MWRLTCVSLALLICVEVYGHPNPHLKPRIVGGADTSVGDWPWMVSLHRNRCHICGGTLINNKWVLTAAHCVVGERPFNLRVHLGRTTQLGINPNEINRTINNFIIHPSYNHMNYDNDIALLNLSSTVSFTNFIQPVSLAAKNSRFTFGIKAWIIGWGGIDVEMDLPDPGTLQKAMVRMYENKNCNYLCRGPITKNMICAGLWEGGRGTWKGDSGGPLLSEQCSKWIQTGVISWGEECAQPNYPDVYTQVSEYQQWISNHTGQNQPTFVVFDRQVPCPSASLIG